MMIANRDEEKGAWQVDLDGMDILFSSLVSYLELDSAYNIFILNPKRDAKMAKYGYRYAFYLHCPLSSRQ